MNLLIAGVDTSTIALWLGHEQGRSTHIYRHAELEFKQRRLDRITPAEGRPGRCRAPNTLLAVLEPARATAAHPKQTQVASHTLAFPVSASGAQAGGRSLPVEGRAYRLAVARGANCCNQPETSSRCWLLMVRA